MVPVGRLSSQWITTMLTMMVVIRMLSIPARHFDKVQKIKCGISLVDVKEKNMTKSLLSLVDYSALILVDYSAGILVDLQGKTKSQDENKSLQNIKKSKRRAKIKKKWDLEPVEQEHLSI